MPHRPAPLVALLATAFALAACGDISKQPETAGTGANPELPAPRTALIPTVQVAPVQGWPEGSMPTPATGMAVTAFARGLDHPRWVYTLPNGDVLVAESNKPADAGEGKKPSIRGWVQGLLMKRAGAGVPSADRITLLRDADGDGKAETRNVFLQNLNSPFGMALVGNELYVANADAVVRFPYEAGTDAASPPQAPSWWTCPAKPHQPPLDQEPDAPAPTAASSTSPWAPTAMWAKTACRPKRAVPPSGRWTRAQRLPPHLRQSGLRNPNGLALGARYGRNCGRWSTSATRLGSDLVPDYLTSVEDGAFYGWPWSYYGQHVDTRVEPARPDMVAKARKPDYALGSHVAPLGLAMGDGKVLGGRLGPGAFVGNHGSWNRKPPSGYEVVFVPFANGQPSGVPQKVLTGFLTPDGQARGRPVGVAFDGRGALLVADDVGNAVWRVAPAAGS